MSGALQQVVEAIAESRRYRNVCEEVVERIAWQALRATEGAQPEAIKRTKRALHQIYGAFVPRTPRFERGLAQLRGALSAGEAHRPVLRKLMAAHASTEERLSVLDRFYGELFSETKTPAHVLDLGCGLNPLSWPWLQELGVERYDGVELDTALVGFADACLSALGAQHRLRAGDLLSAGASAGADAALVLKLLPSLEQQQAGSSLRLLDAIDAPLLFVSFPTRSLGRRAKGMAQSYRAFFEELLAARSWRAERIEFPLELVYRVWK